MHVKKFRARTMQAALSLVREEFGPDAAVLRTREVRGGGLLRWIVGGRVVEISASREMPTRRVSPRPPRVELESFKRPNGDGVDLQRVAKPQADGGVASGALVQVLRELVESGTDERTVGECVAWMRANLDQPTLRDLATLRTVARNMIEDELAMSREKIT